LTLIKLQVWDRVIFKHPFADFLPSFWAKGLLRTLGYLNSSVRFSFLPSTLPGGAELDAGLIFINISAPIPRYGAHMGL
jgi:hypothetical protein